MSERPTTYIGSTASHWDDRAGATWNTQVTAERQGDVTMIHVTWIAQVKHSSVADDGVGDRAGAVGRAIAAALLAAADEAERGER
jgi:hypothetical protein